MSFCVRWREDSSATVLGRLTARNGTGDATGINGEGNWLEQADVSSISYKLFDLDSSRTTAIQSGTLTVGNVILDTPVTTNEIWTKDTIGYNFIHDIPSTWIPDGNVSYRLEYDVTLVGGSRFHAVFEGASDSILGS